MSTTAFFGGCGHPGVSAAGVFGNKRDGPEKVDLGSLKKAAFINALISIGLFQVKGTQVHLFCPSLFPRITRQERSFEEARVAKLLTTCWCRETVRIDRDVFSGFQWASNVCFDCTSCTFGSSQGADNKYIYIYICTPITGRHEHVACSSLGSRVSCSGPTWRT